MMLYSVRAAAWWWMSVEHPGMVVSMGKLKFSEINLALGHLVHHKSLRSEDV
jgi:hypothetical protein